MNQLFILVAIVAAFANAKEEPFSIGLGTLSPSYSQIVGKENVRVNVEQKDNGFAYSVGDPKTGTNTYLNFGGASSGQAINPAGYASGIASGYGSSAAPINSGAYSQIPSLNPAGYGGSASPQYGGPSAYAGSSGFPSPSYGSNNGFAGYAGPSGQSGFGPASAQGAYGSSSPGGASGYYGNSGPEAARKPEENPGQIIPAGFSYHGTEGQAFLRQGDSPNFVISDGKQGSDLGPAQRSFNYNNERQGLVNGLVRYGPGGPARAGLPVGGYAGPQYSGTFREHGGHSP